MNVLRTYHKERTEFSPIFVVGAPRSGTTLLAVLLDRHSRIAIPPETQFFSEFLPRCGRKFERWGHEEMVEKALCFNRIADLRFDQKDARDILKRFREYDKTAANLFRSLLETYSQKEGKIRSGEKSPKHIENVSEIFRSFPNAKVICILRDGRDVVRSLLNVPWAEPGNSRRFGLFCMEWSQMAQIAHRIHRTYSLRRVALVKYEDILLKPEAELARLCDFIGERFEKTQLDPRAGTGVVPNWEGGWKSKASGMIDPERIQAWRKEADPVQVWSMNSMMGHWLKISGYEDTGLAGCPFYLKVKLLILRIPYFSVMRPLSLLGLRLLRIAKRCLMLNANR